MGLPLGRRMEPQVVVAFATISLVALGDPGTSARAAIQTCDHSALVVTAVVDAGSARPLASARSTGAATFDQSRVIAVGKDGVLFVNGTTLSRRLHRAAATVRSIR